MADGEIEVRSAGTLAGGGSPATPEAVGAAAEIGIDIAGHRSSRLTGELARWADLVVTMTAEQAAEVRGEAGDVAPKTFTLKELVSILAALSPAGGQRTRATLLERVAAAERARRTGHAMPADLDVPDPLGLHSSVYTAVAGEIEGLIDDLVRGLVGDHATLAEES